MSVSAERFHINLCNSTREREFIESLHSRSLIDGWYPDCWPRKNRFALSVTICDRQYNLVLRTLRVDFDGTAVLLGSNNDVEIDLDSTMEGVVTVSGKPISDMANEASDWLMLEMSRPIERREWNQLDERGCAPRLWVMADTGESIVARGRIAPSFGPPDRVVSVE